MNVFFTKVHPSILPFYQEVIVGGRRLAVIKFPQG